MHFPLPRWWRCHYLPNRLSMRWESPRSTMLSCVLVSRWESEEWPEQPPRLWQSCAWNKNWNNQQNQKDSSRFVWNKGLYSSGACDSSGLFIARRHENQPQTDRCHGRAFDATCLGRNFFAIWVVSLKLIEVHWLHWHWFWHKASRSMWTFLSVYSSKLLQPVSSACKKS